MILDHIISFTNSPHSLPSFLLVVCARRDGMIALSGAFSNANHFTHLNSGSGVGFTKLFDWGTEVCVATEPGCVTAGGCSG